MATIAAYTINGITRPELILDGFGNIVLNDAAAAFVQAYGIKALYLGCPPNTPYPPVQPSLLFPTDTNGAPDTVAEGAAADTTVGITAHATSILGFPVTYSLTADSSGGGFKINPTTGVVSVLDSNKIDFESSAGHSYSITVKANDGILTTSRTFTIAVSDVAPSTPADVNAAANTVAEGAANGTAVGVMVSATDVNGGAVTYSLTNDANGAFAIDANGVVTVKDSTKIDFETAVGHAYTITARASDGTQFSNTQTFTINVSDVAPSTPTDSNSAANTVAEGAANGSTVGLTASSVDPNGPATTYSLIDDAGGRFAIDSGTGVVTVANGAAIDFETAVGHAYGIIVQATSGAASTTQAFSIGVSDVGPSTPTDANGGANTVFEGAANGTAVGITASATDPGGPPPTYTLTDSAGGRFAIDANTGIVTVANGAAIDFETAAGHAYDVTVQATAGALSTTHTFTIGVGNANEAPAGTDKAVLIAEDTTYTFGVADFGFSDPSDSSAPNSLLAVTIATVPGAGEGTLKNNGVTVNAGDSVSAADIAAGHLVFTPVLDANGSPEATFTFQVQDDGGTANGGVDLDQSVNTFTINVNAGNDAPINSVPGTQSVNEEATLTFSTGNGNAITISDVDIGSGDETVTLTVASGTLALGSTAGLTGFTNNAASITLTGTVANVNAAMNGLTYTGNLNFNGADSLVVSTNDNGNTGTGGPQNDTDSITINVAPVNDAPVNHVPGAQNVNEDTNLVFTGANAITISDVDGGSGDETVTLAVTAGTLALGSTAGLTSFTNNAASITLTGTIANINTALDGLTYSGPPNGFGTVQLNIVTHDNGNTGGGDLTDTDNFNINIISVNDAPSFTVGSNQTALEDSGAHTVNGFITGISSGPSNESTQTVNFLTSNDNTALFSAGPAIDAGGNLTYTLAANANGSATVTVQLHDNGGTSNSGADTSGAQTFTITAGPVNDAPSGTNNSFTILEDSSHTFTAAEFGFTDPVDAANTSGANVFQAVIITTIPGAGTGTLTLDTGGGAVAVTAGQSIAVGDIGGLVFTPAANANGNAEASFTFAVQDNGGTANAGIDTDQSANSITFNVTAVNDAPAGTDATIASVGPHTFTAAEFGFTDPADAAGAGGANALQAVIITSIPAAGTGTLTLDIGGVPTPVTAGQSIAVADIGGLVFTPVGNNPGTLTFQVQDNGGLANSGADTDQSPNTLTIAQNIAPAIDSDGGGATFSKSIAENTTAVTTVHATDPDAGPSPTITYSIVPGDDAAKFGIDATGHLSFLSAPNFENPTDIADTAGNNTYVVTVQAFDGASVDQQTITVTVTDVNELPVAVADTGTITADAAPTLFPVVNNDVLDPDAGASNTIAITGTVTASSVGDPLISNGDATAVVSGNQILVTLGADFQSLAQGETATVTVPYTLTGNSPGDTSSSALSVTVTGVNDGVIANDDAGGSITEDAGLTTFNVHANDTLDVDHTALNTVTINSVNATDAGGDGITGADVTASVTAGNQIQFTLGSDFQKLGGGESSTITIDYTLHGDQAGDTDGATLTYTVTGVNDAPVAQDFTFNGTNSGIGNTSLVLDNGAGATPVDPAGPQKTISGNLLSGATDVDTAASSFTITAQTVSNAAGSITYTAGGDFTYTPAAGFTGNAVFNYTLNDNDGSGNATDTGQVTINVATPKVWYVDANAASGGDGTSDNPFQSLAALSTGGSADSLDGPNDTIFVYGGTYTGGIVLEDGQTLISQSQGLTVNGTALVAATGGNAVINGAVVLASNNTIDGIDFGNSGSASVFALSGSNVGNAVVTDSTINNVSGGAVSINGSGTGMNLQFTSVSSSNASTSAILLQETQGTFNAAAGTLNNGATAAADVRLVGNNTNDNMAFTYGGSINDDQGQLVQITGQSGGTKAFSGAITDGNDGDGQGIDLNGNTGATLNFTGGITLSTAGVTAFNANNSGTVNVTGANNHITATSGTALNITDTTIGASHVTFHDISANGAANGIVLNSTGTSGHLAVTGSGSVAQGGNSSGGTIQNTTGAGISLTTTLSPTLNNMNIQSTSGSGISGTDVTNFTFTNGTINNSGTAHGVDASNIAFNSSPAGATNNVDGTITITNNILSNGYYHGVDIQNRAGTIDNATISNNAITSATAQANSQGSGIHIITFGTAGSAANLTKATIDGNTIVNFPTGAGIAIEGGNSNASGPGGTMGVPNNATNVVAITNNNIHGQSTANPIGSEGIVALVQGGNAGSRSQGNFDIHGNTVTDTLGQGIVLSDFGNATVNAKVNNNTVDTNNIGKLIGSNGIGIGTGVVGVDHSATPLMTVEVIGNTVTDYDGNGIRLVALDANGTLNATVQNNSVGRAAGGGFPSRIRVDSGNENNAGNNTINLDISGNVVIGTSVAGDAPGIGLRLGDGGAATNILRIEGLTPSPATDLQAESYVAGKNPGMFAGTLGGAYNPAKIAEVIHGTTFTATAGNVPQPLLAVAGGVQPSSTPSETHDLTKAELDSVVAAAIGLWKAAGASDAQLAALRAVTFSVDNLVGDIIGDQGPGAHITIDTNAAGHGWFVDKTPFDNSEFTHAQNAAGTDLLTDPSNAAAGHLDLLTTVTHEMGHVLGLPDLTAASDVNELMYIDLVDGERRLPDAGDVAQANGASAAQAEAALPLSAQAAAGTPIVVGSAANDTIDAGHGGNILVGGAGADNFVFANVDIHATTPWSLLSALWAASPVTPPALTHVADYSFAQGDSFDFSALTSAFHGSWASDAQIVRAVEDPSGTFATLQVNASGPSIASWFNIPSNSTASWVNVAQLDGVHAGDDVSVLIDSHAAVHVAHLHTSLLA